MRMRFLCSVFLVNNSAKSAKDKRGGIMKASEISAEIENAFCDCSDFYIRKTYCNEKEIFISAIANLSDKRYISDNILKPIALCEEDINKPEKLKKVISATKLKELSSTNEAVTELLSGNAVLFTDIGDNAIILSAIAKNEDGRSIEEPNSEVVVRGPRQGFVENSETNVALIRKIIVSNELKVESYTIGSITKTSVKIVYLSGIADKNALEILKKRLRSIPIDSVLDSGFIEQFLQGGEYPFFSEVGNSEKPDKVASKIIEGRIAIVCDGSPIVLTVPYLFDESLQSSEDYMKNPYYASLMRMIRFFGLLLALYLPSVYLVMVEYHREMLPDSLLETISKTRENMPFGLFTELVVILLIFELLREVGIRMPKAVGDAVSVVGGLILGDAAIKAGIASETVIMVAALTAVSNFINPPFMNNTILIRLLNIVVSKLFGLFGISISLVVLLLVLASKNSFGVPYMYPFAPSGREALTDALILLPKKAMLRSTSELEPTQKIE